MPGSMSYVCLTPTLADDLWQVLFRREYQKHSHHPGIEITARLLSDVLDGPFMRPALSVGTIRHVLPLLFGQLIRFQQDVIGDAHFPNVVQERTAPYVQKVGFSNPHLFCQIHDHLCHALRVSFRLVVAQIKRADL